MVSLAPLHILATCFWRRLILFFMEDPAPVGMEKLMVDSDNFPFKLVPVQGTNWFIFKGGTCDANQTALSFEEDLDLVRKQKEKLDFEQRTGFSGFSALRLEGLGQKCLG